MINLQPDKTDIQSRSTFSSTTRRQPIPWDTQKPFRILSIDGGGIKGIFPAAFLAQMEQHLLEGRSVADNFDLITGTSTGGILALGLASGITATELCEIYIEKGRNVFPPLPDNLYGNIKKYYLHAKNSVLYRYEREPLHNLLVDIFGSRLLKDVKSRLCIPSFEGKFGEVYIFKTPHHPDYHLDANESLVTIAEATSAAPTYFQPHEKNGFTFVDGGVWANNPVMIALVDALTCFELNRNQIRVLSLGCGDTPYRVDNSHIVKGGLYHLRKIILAATHLQSLNALGQAGLLIGPENLLRVNPQITSNPIELDDWRRAKNELPPVASKMFREFQDRLATKFCVIPADQPHFYTS